MTRGITCMKPSQKFSQVRKFPKKSSWRGVPAAASMAAKCWYPVLKKENSSTGIRARITVFMVRFRSSAPLMCAPECVVSSGVNRKVWKALKAGAIFFPRRLCLIMCNLFFRVSLLSLMSYRYPISLYSRSRPSRMICWCGCLEMQMNSVREKSSGITS